MNASYREEPSQPLKGPIGHPVSHNRRQASDRTQEPLLLCLDHKNDIGWELNLPYTKLLAANVLLKASRALPKSPTTPVKQQGPKKYVVLKLINFVLKGFRVLPSQKFLQQLA